MDTLQTTETPIVQLTETAVQEVKRLMDLQDLTEGGLRLGVKGGGCSGLSYTVNFDDNVGEFDTVCEQDGVKVIIDAKSAIYLEGMQLDYHKDMVSGAFKFHNPNATKTCGCGESFSA